MENTSKNICNRHTNEKRFKPQCETIKPQRKTTDRKTESILQKNQKPMKKLLKKILQSSDIRGTEEIKTKKEQAQYVLPTRETEPFMYTNRLKVKRYKKILQANKKRAGAA